MLEQEIASRAAYDAYEIALPAKKPETEEEKSRRERQEQIERWQKALRDDEARLAKERVGKQSRSPFEFDLKASKNNLLLGSILADCATIIHAATIKEKDEMCQTQMNRVPNIATSIIKVPIHKPEYDENAAGKSSNVEVARKEEEELNSASQESDDENWDFELDELSLEELEEDQEILEETPHQQQSFTDSFEAQIA
ncbi:hypothetical protein M7I_3169 [Glarea lozoyensis 74030]|uniref:Uncharacterized protein n=1 Tax=Glarea lozoyensis (strain ATCC 74030 / MF5533) TaxID=1104152 RepID=H0EKT8_GLAL7|nr:hypothetical protein M7I_3169 [Glarea lozoyensis 74030]